MSQTSDNSREPAIARANRTFMETFKRQDASALSQLYTVDGQLLPAHSDVVQGRPATEKFWHGVMGAGIAEAVLETVDVEGAGDQAWEVGSYSLIGRDAALLDRGKYVIWKRIGDAWFLHRDIWTTTAPRASGLA